MKRSLITTLVIGVVVTTVVGALHATKVIVGFEAAIAQLVSDYARATRVWAKNGRCSFLSWCRCRCRVAEPEEPAAAPEATCCSVFYWSSSCAFVGLLALSDFFPARSLHFCGRTCGARRGRLDRFFAERPLAFSPNALCESPLEKRISSVSNGAFDGQAQAYEASVVVCDIANRHGFASASDPAGFAETMAKFIRQTADGLIERGGYLHAADGEGVVAIFGFPNAGGQRAENAVRAVLDLTKKFRERRQDNGDDFGDWEMHAGISSGAIIARRAKGQRYIPRFWRVANRLNLRAGFVL